MTHNPPQLGVSTLGRPVQLCMLLTAQGAARGGTFSLWCPHEAARPKEGCIQTWGSEGTGVAVCRPGGCPAACPPPACAQAPPCLQAPVSVTSVLTRVSALLTPPSRLHRRIAGRVTAGCQAGDVSTRAAGGWVPGSRTVELLALASAGQVGGLETRAGLPLQS